MIEVKFRLFAPEARAPEYAHDTDSGADIRWFGDVERLGPPQNVRGVTLYAGETAKFWTGIGVRLPAGYELQIRPRSGYSAKAILCAYGTVDESYTGQIAVVLTNLGRNPVSIQRGDKIAQAVLALKAPRMAFAQVDDLGETDRGDRGFGSTGK